MSKVFLIPIYECFLPGNNDTLVGYCMESDYFGDFEFLKNTVGIATYKAG